MRLLRFNFLKKFRPLVIRDELRLQSKNMLYPPNLYKGVVWTKGANGRLLYCGAQVASWLSFCSSNCSPIIMLSILPVFFLFFIPSIPSLFPLFSLLLLPFVLPILLFYPSSLYMSLFFCTTCTYIYISPAILFYSSLVPSKLLLKCPTSFLSVRPSYTKQTK